jgi:hypothetical protein
MRVAALLLAAVFTAGYGYVAHVALASLVATPALAAARGAPLAAGDPASAPVPVWYGGRLDPVVVEAGRAGTLTTIVTAPGRGPLERCPVPVPAPVPAPGSAGWRAAL